MSLFIQSAKKFNLVLCELHYTPIHGKTRSSCRTIEGHYMLICKFDGSSGIALDELDEYNRNHENMRDSDDEDELTHIYDMMELYVSEYATITLNLVNLVPHKTIRNYHNIISRTNYIKPEIAECFELPTNEQIVIIKTVWIKIIQRKWKKIYAARLQIIKNRLLPSSLHTRQITGKWPQHCSNLPGLKGMFYKSLNGLIF